jgi:hypothetical protein
VIEIAEPRFIDQPNLMKKIKQSQDIKTLSLYSERVKVAVSKNPIYGELNFIPAKEVDEIPMDWFKASEMVLKESKEILNAHTVKRLAADAYRQYKLNNA